MQSILPPHLLTGCKTPERPRPVQLSLLFAFRRQKMGLQYLYAGVLQSNLQRLPTKQKEGKRMAKKPKKRVPHFLHGQSNKAVSKRGRSVGVH